MTRNEPITTDIRAMVTAGWDPWPSARERLMEKCDAIDAVHANLERENDRLRQERDMRTAMAEEAYNRGFDEGFASADDWLGQHEDAMAEHGWVRLPKDADGEYIHMGDRMENGELVVRIVLTDGSWEPTVYTASTPNQLHEHYCHDIRHYHAPTVEDVLREFGSGWHEQMIGPETFDIADYVERYAAKLRLA